METLQGATAFITGGASGIGLAIGRAIAAEGGRVALADIDFEELEKAKRGVAGDVLTVTLDTRDRAGWVRAQKAVEGHFGPVDILVNNAGIGVPYAGVPLTELDPIAFDRIVAINLAGVFNGISTFAADMRRRRTGHIINTASMAGVISRAGIGHYAATKFAVVALSEALFAELSPSGVGVSVLCPGLVTTRLGRSTAKVAGDGYDPNTEPPPGMDATYVAARVLSSIKDNDFYIFTHGEYHDAVARRAESLLTALKATPTSPGYVPGSLLPGRG